MGIVNLTDNSFFVSSRCSGVESARDLIAKHLSEGADIIDIGACSTKPGAEEVSLETEWARLEPVLKDLPQGIRLSIDTFRSEIVHRAHETIGPFIVNDISAGRKDPSMLPLVGSLGMEYIAMHSLEHTSDYCDYGGNILKAVHSYFEEFALKAGDNGIENWILDPGFGFGKSIEQNWELLLGLETLSNLGRPVLVGLSRKSMIYKPLGLTPETCLTQTLEAEKVAAGKGAAILRVHDVAATKGYFSR